MTFSISPNIACALGCAVLLNAPILGLSSTIHSAYASDQSTLSEFPGRRVGGGSRGECMSSDTLTAFSPQNHLIETTEETPTLYFSMPAFQEPIQVEFVLKDINGEIIADKLFDAESPGGLTGLDLTNRIAPLEMGKDYEWYFSLLCNENNRAQDIVVHGWMRRVPDTTVHRADPNNLVSEQVQSYQEQGLWHDAIAVLIQSQNGAMTSLNTTGIWSDLLEAEGLQHLIDIEMQPNL